MPNILEAGERAVSAEVKAQLGKVERNTMRVDATSDGAIEGSINATRKGITFTGYVKALIAGPNKGAAAGVRIEKRF